jgi:hypothetical protein
VVLYARSHFLRLSVGLTLCLLMSVDSGGEILDRIMAVVDNRIITLSDIRQEREIRRVLGDVDPKDDPTILRELVDSLIIEEQIAQFPGIEVTDAQVQARMNRLGDMQGVRPDAMREALRRRLRAADFYDLRFRQFLRASDDEIRSYYNTVFLPAAQKGTGPVPPLETVVQEIRNNVIEEKVKHEVDTWLEAVRRRSDIEIFQ